MIKIKRRLLTTTSDYIKEGDKNLEKKINYIIFQQFLAINPIKSTLKDFL